MKHEREVGTILLLSLLTSEALAGARRWQLVLVVWLEALMWALQMDPGHGLPRSPQCCWDFCIEQKCTQSGDLLPEHKQTHTRHPGDVGKMESLCRLVTCTRRLAGSTGVLCLCFLNATSQTSCSQTTGKPCTKYRFPGPTSWRV